jgi:hypothetical protein
MKIGISYCIQCDCHVLKLDINNSRKKKTQKVHKLVETEHLIPERIK